MKVHLRLFIVLLALTLALVACGDSTDSDPDDDDAADDDAVDDDVADDDVSDDDMIDDDTIDDDTVDDDTGDDDTADALPWLHARTGEQAGIFDDRGRQVLLRGVNFNHLGDYFETHPTLPTVAELGPDDWDDAAALGHNVIRLVTTWSAWQPERDAYDLDYLARVRDAVAEANARDMYVVIDMHQDAWSKFVFTPVEETCPEGTHHQRGWDGAPEWATFTDGQPTCTPGSREESPAVIRAWDNFYVNREGIRDELVELWGWIATQFADEAGVAGYDLLNEPGTGGNLFGTIAGLSEFYRQAITEIREAEAQTGAPGHIIFFEPNVHGLPPGINVGNDNLVFAAHNYFASIISGPLVLLDFSFWLYDALGRWYGTALWCGEYNSFSDEQTNEIWTARYADLEDRYLFSGGAWWQWEQECGDPHNAQYPPTPEWLEQQVLRCGDARFSLRTCLSRAYPRAVPGRLQELIAKPCGGDLLVAGSTSEPGTAELWFPAETDEPPAVVGSNIGEAETARVDGGWRIAVPVTGDYEVNVFSP